VSPATSADARPPRTEGQGRIVAGAGTLSTLPTCTTLVYTMGFNSAFTEGLGFPSPVLLIVRNLETREFAFQLFNFLMAPAR
jgi:hypothetical protein